MLPSLCITRLLNCHGPKPKGNVFSGAASPLWPRRSLHANLLRSHLRIESTKHLSRCDFFFDEPLTLANSLVLCVKPKDLLYFQRGRPSLITIQARGLLRFDGAHFQYHSQFPIFPGHLSSEYKLIPQTSSMWGLQ